MNQPHHERVLRRRDEGGARVSNSELFFDLLYAFAITQLSHHLLEHLTVVGMVQTLTLWFAVWLGWQYTCWVTNWFDPDAPPIRLMLFAVMAAGLAMSAALPEAYGERGLFFALAYAAIQVGRTVYVLLWLGGAHPLSKNFQRILGWLVISAGFWIAGGLADGGARMLLWIVAVACEYLSPTIGFRLPGLGRSYSARDWTIDGGHLAERCSLFVLVALGESIIATGAPLSGAAHWEGAMLVAFAVAFVGSVAMWWIYFNTGSPDATHAIEHSDDPGRLGAWFHFLHVVMVGGIIVTAVGDDLSVAHPHGHVDALHAAVLVGGPALYLLGNLLYKRLVYDHFAPSHLAGLGGLALLAPFSTGLDSLSVAALTTVLLLAVAVWESVSLGSRPAAHGH